LTPKVSIRRAPRLGCGFEALGGLPIPWKQLIEAISGMICDPAQDVREPGPWVHVIVSWSQDFGQEDKLVSP
jgi:hypothetical protein